LIDAGTQRPTIPIRLTINGQAVEAEIEPRVMLLDFLRDHLGLTGAKRSCDVQVCGACTVLLDGVPVSACCTLAYEARDRAVTTIEGLAQDGRLHRLQQSFVDHTAVQCGFCTSGMILTTLNLLDENPHPSPEDIRHHLKGNLCRCTGYWNIFEAIHAATQEEGGPE
jgi:carbon-monoxide dehydrogenase small subunit